MTCDEKLALAEHMVLHARIGALVAWCICGVMVLYAYHRIFKREERRIDGV